MDLQTFNVLEEKLMKLINMFDQLKEENRLLKENNQTLRKQLEERNLTIQQLNEESEGKETIQTEIEAYRENENRIRSKVENLLQKLKEFDDFQ